MTRPTRDEALEAAAQIYAEALLRIKTEEAIAAIQAEQTAERAA
jgi:hypothetical protein